MATILVRPQAERDLDDIWDYIVLDNEETARRFLYKLYEKMENLAKNPFMGRKRDELLINLRSFRVDRYIIFYIPKDDGIEVVRVLHGSRDLDNIFTDLSM